MDDKKTIGFRIKKARKARGMSREYLEEECGLPRSAIEEFESGKAIPKYRALRILGAVLGEDPYWLLKGESASPSKACNNLKLLTGLAAEYDRLFDEIADRVALYDTADGRSFTLKRDENFGYRLYISGNGYRSSADFKNLPEAIASMPALLKERGTLI